MNEHDYQQLRELGWRRKLTPNEEATLQDYLTAHPDAQDDWQAEAELNQLLDGLPDAPVSSNFTTRVVQAARLEAAARERQRGWKMPLWMRISNWVPKAAMASLAVGLVLSFGYHQHQVNTRVTLARNVVQVTDAVAASDPDLMQDFEPIRQLSNSQPKADVELIALMK